MADAPASGGGSGWGALEVILALVLAIGLISTLTGNPITPLFGPASSSKTGTASTSGTRGTAYGCTVVVSSPKAKEKIDTQVTVAGSIGECSNSGSFPSTLYVQVVDSKGSVLSTLTPIAISKNLFGDMSFSAPVPLQGVARSTAATVIISGPAPTTGKALSIRVPITLKTGTGPVPVVIPTTSDTTTTTTTTNTGASFVPSPTYVPNPTYSSPTQQQQPTYTPPSQENPPQQSIPDQNTGSGNGGGGTTF